MNKEEAFEQVHKQMGKFYYQSEYDVRQDRKRMFEDGIAFIESQQEIRIAELEKEIDKFISRIKWYDLRYSDRMEKAVQVKRDLSPVKFITIPEEDGGGFNAYIPALGSELYLGNGDTKQEAIDNLLTVMKFYPQMYRDERDTRTSNLIDVMMAEMNSGEISAFYRLTELKKQIKEGK